ncbi:hypothetical protein GUITHDRAFT_98962 [Guillardia theta CCMP2712]|uniref:Uncharacterized protein n=1 Tax=Guillardia theta (strain CCMP2712) TaxID=905079 RepID=L1K3M4_GUITC|nr:hypothetical protein GUITHDRAFT_98962 [Guillardia theta CCMP2712]EKX55182.1 hypothetical protein GUITHDRAFT_98962 [Guillardia theta CCMP2712]|eukprot:XP_005842162.1 hypothetical protein GUITHDRAFT_98962 [Guillardia theta CCMP2712]
MACMAVAMACMAAGAAYGWAPPHAGRASLGYFHAHHRKSSCFHAARATGSSSRRSNPCAPVMAAATSSKDTWLQGWRSMEEEIQPYTIPAESMEGSIPSDLVGSLYRNGPGKFELGTNKLQHPLDGDGLVSAFTFAGDGTCLLRSRFVRTESYVKESTALENGYSGLPLFRGFFGSKGMQKEVKNCANTNAMLFGGRLLALYECGLPFELDPASLYTIGQTRIAKSLPADGSFTARPRFDPANDRLVGFTYKALGGGEVEFIEYSQSWEVESKKSFNAGGHAIFHDFAFTRRNYILHQAPTSFNSLKYNLGIGSAIDNIQYDGSKKSTIHIVPRDGGKARSFTVDAGL